MEKPERVRGSLAASIVVLLASGCGSDFGQADIDAAVAKALAEQAATTTAATTTATATTIPVPEGVIYCGDSRGCTHEQIEEIKLGVRTLAGVRIGRDSSFPVYRTAEERRLADLEGRVVTDDEQDRIKEELRCDQVARDWAWRYSQTGELRTQAQYERDHGC
ncbi:hypothetical protein [Candidatus Poriferisodalis sp.]|uniref:hypothetical protein n=1 Tax=Candidatus Poriferisodalis sp. TaxID=3101277 RepID=UPI003B027C6E